jgi:secreted effector protein SseB
MQIENRTPVTAFDQATNPAAADHSAVVNRGDSQSVFGGGIAAMMMMMAMLQNQSFALFDDINAKTKRSRDSQDMANNVESTIASLDPNKPDATGTLSPDVIKYMHDNGIKVDGKTIDEYMAASADKNGGLNKGQLAAVKAALESDSGRSSDFVQQGQLQIQQILQTFNIATQMANSLQSMGAEMNKGIASSIR